MNGAEAVKSLKKRAVVVGVVMVLAAAAVGMMLSPALAQEKPTGVEPGKTVSTDNADTFKFKGTIAIAIGILVAGGSIAAAYAVAGVGSAAIGAVTEKPEMMGRALIFVALAEGIAIYGLLMAFLLMGYLK